MEERFKIGDTVQVICDVPIYGWGNIKKYDIGKVASVGNDQLSVDFPNSNVWQGKDYEFILIENVSDIQVDPLLEVFAELSPERKKEFMKGILEQLHLIPDAYNKYLTIFNSLKTK